MKNFNDKIEQLVRSSPGQCSVDEYSFIVKKLQELGPCNFLVFGLGKDTSLWLDVNVGGNTVFLENHDGWISTVTGQVNRDIDVRKIEYTTDLSQWSVIIDDPEKLILDLDDDIVENSWDLIFIDSPMGFGVSGVPGRMQSIYTASTLKCCDYILHDVNRVVEKTYGEKYFGDVSYHIDKLNYWKCDEHHTN